jgi:hypothetical protein
MVNEWFVAIKQHPIFVTRVPQSIHISALSTPQLVAIFSSERAGIYIDRSSRRRIVFDAAGN